MCGQGQPHLAVLAAGAVRRALGAGAELAGRGVAAGVLALLANQNVETLIARHNQVHPLPTWPTCYTLALQSCRGLPSDKTSSLSFYSISTFNWSPPKQLKAFVHNHRKNQLILQHVDQCFCIVIQQSVPRLSTELGGTETFTLLPSHSGF